LLHRDLVVVDTVFVGGVAVVGAGVEFVDEFVAEFVFGLVVEGLLLRRLDVRICKPPSSVYIPLSDHSP